MILNFLTISYFFKKILLLGYCLNNLYFLTLIDINQIKIKYYEKV